MLESGLTDAMPGLTSLLSALYGGHHDIHTLSSRLITVMKEAVSLRSAHLLERDRKVLSGNQWWLQREQVGITLYVDLFADSLVGLVKKIPELKDLGVTYVHLMPLFRSPEGENDGGYAVSSYREVDSRLGTVDDLAELARKFHEADIRLVLDFVFNHTSDDHDWALAAKRGESPWKEFYFILSKEEAEEWNRSLREIFPDVRRGSFTFVPEAEGWVWTTFNSFQWDLNYSNPEVFLAMCTEMLALANLGVDVLRLDALAFVWKRKGTSCENLEEAHTLIQAFRAVAAIACPSLVFKSEAIVHPDEVVRYIGKDQCELSYNPLQMALFWESLATRDTRLLRYSLRHRWYVPEACAWVNYIRCHDDIGWTFSDEDARTCGIDPVGHRAFLNRFYTGRHDGSFARGEAFQYNPENGDCRVCGTMASLAGLEEAALLYQKGVSDKDKTSVARADLYGEMAVLRIEMLYSVLFALPGIPLLYAGDEAAVLNDYSYIENPEKKNDSRWVHRIASDSIHLPIKDGSKVLVKWISSRQKRVHQTIKNLSRLRSKEDAFNGTVVHFWEETGDPAVFAFLREGIGKKKSRLLIVANFSENKALFHVGRSVSGIDILGSGSWKDTDIIEIDGYQTLWIRED